MGRMHFHGVRLFPIFINQKILALEGDNDQSCVATLTMMKASTGHKALCPLRSATREEPSGGRRDSRSLDLGDKVT